MTRKMSMSVFLLVVAVVAAGYAQDESVFFMRCDSCGAEDSGTASGDGSGVVGPSNGSKGFRGGAPSYSSIGLNNGKDLRLVINAPAPTPNEFCIPEAECQYDAVLVNRIKFFVSAIRTPFGTPSIPALYCATNSCATYNEIRLGSTLGVQGDLRAVVYVTEVLTGGPIQVDVGDPTPLQLTKAQWQELNRIVGAVKAVDHNDVEFFLGLAVSTSPVDPLPNDGVAVRFVELQPHLFISVLSSKPK
jgi:hypothetical protein